MAAGDGRGRNRRRFGRLGWAGMVASRDSWPGRRRRAGAVTAGDLAGLWLAAMGHRLRAVALYRRSARTQSGQSLALAGAGHCRLARRLSLRRLPGEGGLRALPPGAPGVALRLMSCGGVGASAGCRAVRGLGCGHGSGGMLSLARVVGSPAAAVLRSAGRACAGAGGRWMVAIRHGGRHGLVASGRGATAGPCVLGWGRSAGAGCAARGGARHRGRRGVRRAAQPADAPPAAAGSEHSPEGASPGNSGGCDWRGGRGAGGTLARTSPGRNAGAPGAV